MIRELHEKLEIPIECLVQDYKLKKPATGRTKSRSKSSRAAA
jgi:hypothetical protein